MLSMISYWSILILKYSLSSFSVTNTSCITQLIKYHMITDGSHDREGQSLADFLGVACPSANNVVHLYRVGYNDQDS